MAKFDLPKQYQENYIYQEALNGSCRMLKRFFANNQYLLGLNGMTVKQQVIDMESKGLKISFETIRNIKRGTNRTCNTVYINLFAVYWGLDASLLLYRDISKSKILKYVNSPLCSYSNKNNI